MTKMLLYTSTHTFRVAVGKLFEHGNMRDRDGQGHSRYIHNCSQCHNFVQLLIPSKASSMDSILTNPKDSFHGCLAFSVPLSYCCSQLTLAVAFCNNLQMLVWHWSCTVHRVYMEITMTSSWWKRKRYKPPSRDGPAFGPPKLGQNRTGVV